MVIIAIHGVDGVANRAVAVCTCRIRILRRTTFRRAECIPQRVEPRDSHSNGLRRPSRTAARPRPMDCSSCYRGLADAIRAKP